MVPQHVENLAAPPSLRHRPIRRLEVAHRLRPLARGWLGAHDAIVGRVRRGHPRPRLALRGPVVDVPVVFVEKQVVLRQEARRHGGEVRLGKRR